MLSVAKKGQCGANCYLLPALKPKLQFLKNYDQVFSDEEPQNQYEDDGESINKNFRLSK